MSGDCGNVLKWSRLNVTSIVCSNMWMRHSRLHQNITTHWNWKIYIFEFIKHFPPSFPISSLSALMHCSHFALFVGVCLFVCLSAGVILCPRDVCVAKMRSPFAEQLSLLLLLPCPHPSPYPSTNFPLQYQRWWQAKLFTHTHPTQMDGRVPDTITRSQAHF